MKLIASLFCVCLMLVACSESSDTNASTNLAFVEIAHSNLYGSGDDSLVDQNLVIQNETEWNNLMTQIDAFGNISDVNETEIDFLEYTVIAIFDEIRESSGYDKRILKIAQGEETIIVTIVYESPSGIVTYPILQPYHIVKIVKTDLPIVFQ